MDEQNVFDYIKSEENKFRTERIPLTSSKSWNMLEHIERCTNVSNGWFNKGSNEDGLRPYQDIVTPIIDVAFRSEGFNVKDIIPYVNNADKYYLSLFVKKYHPQWARKYELDTFIDEVVESSVIYDLVLAKNINDRRPEVVDLKTIAFCDQTDVMAGPICIKHQYTISELVGFKGKWDDDKIDQAIVMALAEKKNAIAGDQTAKMPSKYIEVYELRGNLPESWIDEGGEQFKYTPQMHIVCFYTGTDGSKNGITLYSGKDKPLAENFKALKIDMVRSKGRACGRSIVERLFEPQVWTNYSAIKLKKMLDSAVNLLQTDSEEFGNQRISDLKDGMVLKHEQGKPITKVDMSLQNVPALQSFQATQETSARTLGAASEAALGQNPVSGTPFALQQLIVQQGEGIHEYRRGKISTFFSDVLYRDWIIEFMMNDLNSGKEFSEILSLEELNEIADVAADNYVANKIKSIVLKTGSVPDEVTPELTAKLRKEYIDGFMSSDRKFFKDFKDTFKDIEVNVMVNVAGKQKNMAANADKISNMIMMLMKAGVPIQGLSKAINQLLEESGMAPIDFRAALEANKAEPVSATLPPQASAPKEAEAITQ